MRCVKMDNLDHSMHIAECDWTVFYEESEECDLSRPPLVCHDSSNLSESEDSGNSSPVCSTGRKGPGPDSGAANRGEVGSSAAGCCVEESNYSGCEKYTSRHVIQGGAAAAGGGEDDDLATKAEMHLAPSVAAQHIARDPDDGTGTTVPTERGNDRRSDERQPELEGEDGDVQMEGDVGDPPSGTGAAIDVNEWRAGEAGVGVGVGVGVALRGEKERWFVTVNVRRPRAVPVKKRRKRNHKDMCGPGQDRSLEGGLELQVMTESCDFQGGADSEDVTTENQTQVKKSAEEDPESTRMGILSGASVMSLTPGALDGLSEEPVAPRFPTRSLSEPMTSAESAESEEFEDVGGFSSTHSSDSESYLSAAESLEELAVERRHSQGSSPPRGNQNLSTLTVITGDAALSPRVTAANSKGHQRADPTLTFPSAVPSVDKLPGDNDTPSATRSALGCSPGDRLLSVPDLRVTPCCEADCPETYAEAAGRARPVYAISAFWDEMEKLTINDILQLRTGGSGPPGERSLCDGGVTDVSSAADSDYFTQPDESKPDRSSWDFSTSDGKEEHSSGSLGPDPKGEKQQCTSDAGEEEEEEEESSTGNEGKATPAPSEDIERKRPEDEDSKAFISRRRARPRQIRKCQSRPNVRALSTEDLSVRLLLGDDGSSRFLEAERLSAPTPLMDGLYEIVFPEVFQDALGEEETKGDFRCVSPVVDFPLWTFRDEMPFFSLHDFQRGDEKPIPIFSSSRPAVRDLTFPSAPWVFFSEDDHFSPARVLSRSFVHGSDCWRSLSRRIRFRDKGGSRRGTPCSRAFPVAVEKSADPPFTALTEGRVSPAPSQLFRELAGQQRVWEAFRTTRREGIFSTLKQSDMCLVCIAFASWVLKSSDPDGADAWKAAVLANVSALSAIQYLRHYVKKKNPS